MNCPNCAANAERAIAVLAGVDSTCVEFESETAIVEYDPQVGTLERIAFAVEHACDSNRFPMSIDGRHSAGRSVQATVVDEEGSREDWP